MLKSSALSLAVDALSFRNLTTGGMDLLLVFVLINDQKRLGFFESMRL